LIFSPSRSVLNFLLNGLHGSSVCAHGGELDFPRGVAGGRPCLLRQVLQRAELVQVPRARSPRRADEFPGGDMYGSSWSLLQFRLLNYSCPVYNYDRYQYFSLSS
jgi:hypothetical protein